MYLKKLEMKGFKSFADKTEIIFEEGVTCVVGPNGSGKSNITDAVRWVLGEQRVKTLRGSKMEDIIFNGTKRRKPLGYAEVSLFFDNSSNVFPYDFSEVVVSRKLFRSGESEYSLNGCQCKLKEVRELFMDTGIGTDGYSIIGQGRIERILSNNKDERKLIFEEASGIAKYKSRKLESERKLQNTDLNLQRVEDIVNELGLRVGPLKIERDKAIEYKEISEKLREIEINQLVNVYDRNEKKLMNEKEKELDINSKIKSFNNSIEESKEAYSEEIMKLDGANERIENINKNHFDVQHSIKELEGEDNLLKEKIKNKESEIKRISVEIDSGNDLIEGKNKEIFKLDADKKTFFDEIKDLRDEKNLIEKNYSDILENYENIEKSVGEKKSKIIDTLNIIERENNDISNIDKNIEIFKTRSVEINSDLDVTISKIRGNNKILFDKDKEIIEINNELAKISGSKNDLQKSVDTSKKELNDLNEELKKLESSITKFNSEKEVLISMNEDYEGFDNSVRNALKKSFEDKNMGRGIVDVVASLFDVEKKYEKAIEVALGKKIQNIVCENENDAKRIIDYLKKKNLGRVTFLPLSNVRGRGDDFDNLKKLNSSNGYLGKASELISYNDKYKDIFENLLGRIIIADNYENAVGILKINNLKYKVITLDGEILIPGGAITGGSFKSSLSNILGRKRKISELEALVNDYTEKFENTIKRIKEIKDMLNEYGSKISNFDLRISELKLEFIEKNSESTRLKESLSDLSNSKERLLKELSLVEKQIVEAVELKEKKQENIENLKKSKDLILDEVNKESELTKTFSEDIENYKNQVTSIKINLASKEERLKNINVEIERNKREKDSAMNNINFLEESLVKVLEEKDILIETVASVSEKVREKIALKEKMETEREKLLSIRLLSEKNISIKKRELENISKNIIDNKEALHKIEVNIAKYEVEKENVIKEIWDKYELSIIEALKFKKDDDFKDSIKEVRDIKKRISELGIVNLNAIEEYKEVKERYDFLSEQKTDLIKAQRSLRKVISELETLMKDQFLSSFQVIKENFSTIFSDLFMGGKADLIIEDEENILNSDILILAQPLGKKLQDLTLMSGGEKALTAIALLFSILKAKPAPFCILDEIEAALDDVNVVRFAEFLRHFTMDSQFVVITHRKGTMDIADSIYGVTMEEHGVSKLVSVKLEDAV